MIQHLAVFTALGLVTTTALARLPPPASETVFRLGRVPAPEEVAGYWTGRCREASGTADAPAVLLVRPLDTGAGPAWTLSYFWRRDAEPKRFDLFSTKALDDYAPLRSWFDEEQWSPLRRLEGALENEFVLGPSRRHERALRVVANTTNEGLAAVLRVRRLEDEDATVERYCTFARRASYRADAIQLPVRLTKEVARHRGKNLR